MVTPGGLRGWVRLFLGGESVIKLSLSLGGLRVHKKKERKKVFLEMCVAFQD